MLELDGDLDGDIVSAIRFSGQNVQPIGGIVWSAARRPPIGMCCLDPSEAGHVLQGRDEGTIEPL